MNKHPLCSSSFAVLLLFLASIAFATASTDSRHTVAPVPLINQPLVPDAIVPGSGDFTLTINGTGFLPRSVVKWNGHKRATHFVSDHSVTAIIKASDMATANTASITVATCAPGGGTSNVVYFPVTNATASLSFTQPVEFGGGEDAFEIRVCDLNEDGIVDLALTNSDP